MKVGSAAYGGDVIDHGQMTVYDDAEVAGRVDDLDWWRQDQHVTNYDREIAACSDNSSLSVQRWWHVSAPYAVCCHRSSSSRLTSLKWWLDCFPVFGIDSMLCELIFRTCTNEWTVCFVLQILVHVIDKNRPELTTSKATHSVQEWIRAGRGHMQELLVLIGICIDISTEILLQHSPISESLLCYS